MDSNDLAWSGRSWRMPAWFWLSLAAMAVGTLHILLDSGIGLFPLQGRLSPTVGQRCCWSSSSRNGGASH